MATVKSFEDLICWQKARELTKFIYRITANPAFLKDFSLKDQIRRAVVSIMSNIAEGFDRGTKIELINFFFIAKGSCGEVKSQLYIALDGGYISKGEFDFGYKLGEEVSRLLHSFIQKVKTGAQTGLQYKMEKRPDPAKEILKQFPELYKKFYPND